MTATADRKRIMVVDPEGDVRELVRDVLAAEGYLVRTAAGCREAWEAIGQDGVDLVVADPRALSGAPPLLSGPRPVPFILYSTFGVEVVMGGPVVALVPKPFALADLREACRFALRAD